MLICTVVIIRMIRTMTWITAPARAMIRARRAAARIEKMFRVILCHPLSAVLAPTTGQDLQDILYSTIIPLCSL